MKIKKWKLLVIVAICLLLRCLFIESRSIQYDDAFSIFLASRNLTEIVKGTAADTMPPLYYFMLHFWMQISMGLWWLRLLSVLLSVISILVLYSWIKEIAGENAGLIAAGLTAISPLHIYHAQDLRMYALLALCQMGYILFFTLLWAEKDTGKRKFYWAGFVLCGSAAMYSHNLAIFVLIVPNIFLLLKRQFRFLYQVVLSQILIGLICLPWLWFIPGQIAKIQQAFWTPQPGIVEVFQSVILFHATLPLPGTWLIVAAILSLQIFVVVGIEVWKNKVHPGIGFVLACFLLPPVMLFIMSYVMRPVFVTRGFLFSSLAYLGLAGIVISRSFPKGIGGGILSFFILCALIAFPYQQKFEQFPRSPFRAACGYLDAQYAQGDLILHDNKLSFFPCAYFEPDLPQKFLIDEKGSHNDTLAIATQDAMQIFPETDVVTAVKGYRHIYYVIFQDTIRELQDAGQPTPETIKWLSEHFPLKSVQEFGDLAIYEFDG